MLSVVLDNLRTPENVGSIFRSADAFGVGMIYLLGDTPGFDNTKVKRSARSTERVVSHRHFESADDFLDHIPQDHQLLALEITTDSDCLRQFVPQQRPICVIVGNERQGVSAKLLAAADGIVHIPMLGQNASINVAVATGIALYQLSPFSLK